MSSSGHWKVQDFVLRKQGWEKRKIYIQHQQKKVFIQSMWIFDEMIIKSLIDFWWFETRFIWPFSPLGIIDFNPISRRYWLLINEIVVKEVKHFTFKNLFSENFLKRRKDIFLTHIPSNSNAFTIFSWNFKLYRCNIMAACMHLICRMQNR